jgi:integrase
MATFQNRKTRDGVKAVLAQVRVKGFDPTSKTFPDKTSAKAWAEDLERKLRQNRARGNVQQSAPTYTFTKLAGEYLADPEVAKVGYHHELSRQLSWWCNVIGDMKVMALSVSRLRAARAKLKAEGRGDATTNRYLSAARSCWNWGLSAELVPAGHEWPKRLMLSEPKGRTRYLTDDELGRLLAAARAHSPALYAAVVVSLATGFRASELIRLEWTDVDFDAPCVRILQTKNGQPRSIYLSPSAADALRALKKATVVGRRVFLAPSGMPYTVYGLADQWQKVRAAAGLANFRQHDLRHSCASYLAQAGASLVEIGAVLGHKSPSVTMRYSHLVAGKPVTGHAALDAKLRGDRPQ